MSFAAKTSVQAEKSRVEIELLVRRHAGRDAEFSYGRAAGVEAVQFVAYGRRVKFVVPAPTDADAKSRARDGRRSSSWTPGKAAVDAWVEQEVRRRWRCLLLVVRAKLEAVEAGICGEDKRVAFEREFLAYVVVPSGETVYEAIQAGLAGGRRLLPPLNPSASDGGEP